MNSIQILKRRSFGCALLLGLFAFCMDASAVDPLYPNSIVSNDLDFILDSDPNVLDAVAYITFAVREMPDSRTDELFADAYVFESSYSDGYTVEIWAHEDFGSYAAAEHYVLLLANAMGQQQSLLRQDLHHVVLHQGDETAFAEEVGKFFVIYSDNMDTRISEHDLQETIFHESTHVALEVDHATSPGWVLAQQNDPGFITDYAQANPTKEDVPESAIFAFALLNHPGRLPADVEDAVRAIIPNRIEYLSQIDGFVVTRIFSDAFQSGDTSAWSTIVQ